MSKLIVAGDAQPNNVLIGKKYSAGTDYNVEGTMLKQANGARPVSPESGFADGANGMFSKVPNGYFYEDNVYIRSSHPDFIANNILAGKAPFGLAGSIPNKTIENYWQPATNLDGSGMAGRIFLMPPNGYYENSWVYRDHADFIANNIIAGKSPFGLVGTAERKMYATGQVMSSVSTTPFYRDTGNAVSLYYIQIPLLGFVPKLILCFAETATIRYYVIYSTLHWFDSKNSSNYANTSHRGSTVYQLLCDISANNSIILSATAPNDAVSYYAFG